MLRPKMLVALVLQVTVLALVQSAKQQIQLSDSYLPVAMQIIAHLTDQMAYETRDEVTPTTTRATTPQPRPTTQSTTTQSTTTRATSKPSTWPSWTTQSTYATTRPTQPAWTTQRPYVTTSWPGFKPTTLGWWQKPSTINAGWWQKPSTINAGWWQKPNNTIGWWTTKRPDTTPFHRPGLYAPFSPPKPFFNRYESKNFLLPMYNSQYTVIKPEQTRSEDPLLSIQEEEVKPLMEPAPDSQPLLPPHFEVKISSRSDGFVIDDISEESLQYLSDDVRDMIRMAKDPNDQRVVDVWERSGPQPATTKAKMSSSNLRLLLLYDLLSRDAKAQRLSDYSGFSPDVMKVLVESSTGGARQQLRTALSKMVERKDCNHDYANNRAREMVDELAKDESKLSSEIRYLQPLVYKF